MLSIKYLNKFFIICVTHWKDKIKDYCFRIDRGFDSQYLKKVYLRFIDQKTKKKKELHPRIDYKIVENKQWCLQSMLTLLKEYNKMFLNFNFPTFCFLFIYLEFVWTNEIRFDRVEITPLIFDGVLNIKLFRIAKINRTSYALNADGDLYIDFDQNVKAEVSFHYWITINTANRQFMCQKVKFVK